MRISMSTNCIQKKGSVEFVYINGIDQYTESETDFQKDLSLLPLVEYSKILLKYLVCAVSCYTLD